MRFDGRARGWVEAVTGETVVRARRMTGGTSSIVHDVRLADGTGVVLRRTIEDPVDPAQDPVAEAEREVTALAALAGWDRVPQLLGADLTATACGAPAVLATRLPGRPWVTPDAARLGRWLDGLAEAIHGVQDAAGPAPRAAFPQGRANLFGDRTPPPWARSPEAWRWAWSMVTAGLPPGGPETVVHRDLHPGNVLFHRQRLSGVVDWESMARGPVELDVSRCRVQVGLLHGPAAADGLLDRCRDLVPTYDLGWDALVACELVPWAEELLGYNRIGATLTLDGVRTGLDDLVVRAYSA